MLKKTTINPATIRKTSKIPVNFKNPLSPVEIPIKAKIMLITKEPNAEKNNDLIIITSPEIGLVETE
ncbi:hypothetical protein YDYSY3_26550 [Paenibacillus chitinolyticus]|nr:hypothetical protein YDYSY3_26550 [Paenibacillus chitinolyticus]